ncbi:CLUMA_CG012707, isoform A [Clunio marinus]|uniref:CLUMA_CG012707, isoform A n=1 Tax=Clunio marinus TaxID=568069 RepID=A0A1J1IGQ6_9DIPT|nr:CLUMA_CG012707, isoform A [Clunio marinus]
MIIISSKMSLKFFQLTCTKCLFKTTLFFSTLTYDSYFSGFSQN